MVAPVKILLLVSAVAVVAIIAAILIVPHVLPTQTYKEALETQVSQATGLTVTMGDRIKPSVFPWVGIKVRHLAVNNPAGFKEKHLVTIESFEVRVKLLPLLARRVEIRRFSITGATLTLEKNAQGAGNWQYLTAAPRSTTSPATSPPLPAPKEKPGLPIRSLEAERLSVLRSTVVYIDQATAKRSALDKVTLIVQDLKPDHPVAIRLSAELGNQPLSLTGTVGPIRTAPDKHPIPFDLAAVLMDHLKITLKGRLTDLSSRKFDAALQVAPFSPRDLLAALQHPLPFEPVDPNTFVKLGLAFDLSGSPAAVAISKGELTLDESRVRFEGHVNDFSGPDLKLALDLNHLDLDRYLPASSPPAADNPADRRKEADTVSASGRAGDRATVRKLTLDASLKAGTFKLRNARAQNVHLHATARDGVIRIDPLGADFYQGKMTATARVDVRQNRPRTALEFNIAKIQSAPLIKDVLQKEVVEGALTATGKMQFSGARWQLIRKSLTGSGALDFNDGAIVGIDLADMVRNVQSAFGMAERPARKPRTDFSELLVPFTITRGLTRIEQARLSSPLLRVTAEGTADLVKEQLDLRVAPKFVGTLVGQGDTRPRSGVTVPVLVGGTFSNPTFKPDLKGLLRQELKDPELLDKVLPKGKAREVLKGLPF